MHPRRNASSNLQFLTNQPEAVIHWATLYVCVCVCLRVGGLGLKCDSTGAETRFRLSAKRTNPFKSAGASVQSTTASRCVRISGSNAGYTMFRSSVKGTGYPLHSPVSPSLLLPCVNVCHHISTGLYSVVCRCRSEHGGPRQVTHCSEVDKDFQSPPPST